MYATWRDTGELSYDYELAVHEAGHALGLSNMTLNLNELYREDWKLPYHTAHPTIPDAAMNYDRKTPHQVVGVPASFHEPDCSPHPFDILAVYALYQTVSK